MSRVVAIVPAYNRADTVAATVAAIRALPRPGADRASLRPTPPDVEVVVVDDGSSDATAAQARAAGAQVVHLARNGGKGAAVAAGVAAMGAPDAYLLLDADLGASASHAAALLAPVLAGEADMSIGVFGAVGADGGFGLVKRFAGRVIEAETGMPVAEPLSGQRAVRGALLRRVELADRFGMEIGLTLDAAAHDAVICELELGFEHRATGRTLTGFAHRARIGRDVCRAASARIGIRRTVRHLAVSLLGGPLRTSPSAVLRSIRSRLSIRSIWLLRLLRSIRVMLSRLSRVSRLSRWAIRLLRSIRVMLSRLSRLSRWAIRLLRSMWSLPSIGSRLSIGLMRSIRGARRSQR